MAVLYRFLWLSSVPQYICPTSSFSSHLAKVTSVVFVSWPLWIMLQWTQGCIYLWEQMFPNFSGRYPEEGLLGPMVTLFLILTVFHSGCSSFFLKGRQWVVKELIIHSSGMYWLSICYVAGCICSGYGKSKEEAISTVKSSGNMAAPWERRRQTCWVAEHHITPVLACVFTLSSTFIFSNLKL